MVHYQFGGINIRGYVLELIADGENVDTRDLSGMRYLWSSWGQSWQ